MRLTKTPFTVMKFVVRDSDGTVWEPSTPDGYTEGDAIAALITGKSQYYFRRIVYYPGWLGHFGRGWYRTGETWQPEDHDDWHVTRSAPTSEPPADPRS